GRPGGHPSGARSVSARAKGGGSDRALLSGEGSRTVTSHDQPPCSSTHRIHSQYHSAAKPNRGHTKYCVSPVNARRVGTTARNRENQKKPQAIARSGIPHSPT